MEFCVGFKISLFDSFGLWLLDSLAPLCNAKVEEPRFSVLGTLLILSESEQFASEFLYLEKVLSTFKLLFQLRFYM